MEELLNYEWLVYSIIRKYYKTYDFDDLYQVSMIGLIDAYNHFDKSYKTKFSTFAYYYIIGEVNKYIRNNYGLKVSKNMIDFKKKILMTKESMIQKLGREPTNEELALYLDIELKDLEDILLSTSYILDIDDNINDLYTFDNTNADYLDLKNEINNLPEDEKKLIIARYYNNLTQNETSSILGISQVQVSRNETKILKKLKDKLYV